MRAGRSALPGPIRRGGAVPALLRQIQTGLTATAQFDKLFNHLCRNATAADNQQRSGGRLLVEWKLGE